MKKPLAPAVRVYVSRQIIDEAEIKHSGHCMISDAIKAAMPGAKHVATDVQTVRFTDSEEPLRYTYLTPRSAAMALLQFDQGIHTEPFTFRLSRGHVAFSDSKAGKFMRADGRKVTPEQKVAAKKASEKAHRVKKMLSTKVLRTTRQGRPVPVGGKPYPIMGQFAKRREFGMKTFAAGPPTE